MSMTGNAMDDLEGEIYHLHTMLSDLARVAEESVFWIDKSTPEGQLAHANLKIAIERARKP